MKIGVQIDIIMHCTNVTICVRLTLIVAIMSLLYMLNWLCTCQKKIVEFFITHFSMSHWEGPEVIWWEQDQRGAWRPVLLQVKVAELMEENRPCQRIADDQTHCFWLAIATTHKDSEMVNAGRQCHLGTIQLYRNLHWGWFWIWDQD